MVLPSLVMALSIGGLSFFLTSGSSGTTRALFTGLPMVLMATMMITVQRYSYRNQVRQYEAEVARINTRYEEHLMSKKQDLEQYADEQRRIIQQENPSFRELERRVVTRAKTLWERQPFDNDFAAVRLGLGPQPLCVEIKAPEPDDEDLRVMRARSIARDLQIVDDVPIIANLNRLGTVGIQGSGRSDALYMTFNIIASLVVHHSPDELHLYLISHRQDAQQRWSWLRWIPHARVISDPDQAHISLSPSSDEPVLLSLSQLLRQRRDKERHSRQSAGFSDPHIVVIFDMARELQGQGRAVIEMLLQQKPDQKERTIRASALFVDNPIPPQINAFITVNNNQFEYRETWMADANQIHYHGSAEFVTTKEMERLARRLAPLRTEESAGSTGRLPSSVRLVELLNAEQPHEVDLDQLYSENYDPDRVMSFPIGLDIDLRPLEVILRESGQGGYGSHAIVAGMTGAGKSVLLQALVLSMALNNSPAHLNFVLADFKGGDSELAKLQGLPHLAGFVTDLNPALVERFRIALESEVLRRKTLFDNAKEVLGHNVANIRTYNRLQPDAPLPHLVVVLDEFAHGLNINPDFQKAIDIIASQGRALGIHLVLSTQRPADFDDKIRPHIDIRISLRVARKEDSKIMFNRDEAFTELTRPGQACLQVGDNEIFEIFQAARADLPYLPEGTVSAEQVDSIDNFTIFRVGLNGHRKQIYEHKTNKDNQDTKDLIESEAEVLVAHMRAYAMKRFPPVQLISLPPLPPAEALPVLPLLADKPVFCRWQGTLWAEEQRQPEERLRAPMGLLDLPAERAQRPFVIDLNQRDGNFMIIGPSDAGVALFLRTLLLATAATHTPRDIQFYILARGPALAVFEDLPHCGALIHSKEVERIDRLFRFLEQEVERRRRLMGEYRVDTMEALRTAYSEEPLPALVVIIEEFTGFQAEHDERLAQVQKLTGDCKSIDIHFVLASNSITSIRAGLRDNFRNCMAFGQKSASDYRDILGKAVPPLDEIPGRGYTNTSQDVLECQVASPAAQPDIDIRSPGATIQLRKIVQAMAKVWGGAQPVPIEALPVRLELAQLWARLSFHAHVNGSWQTAPLGLDFDNLNPVTIDFNRFEPYSLVIGPPQSGKTSFLATLALAVAATLPPQKLEIVVLTAGPSPLQALSCLPQVQIASTTVEVQAALSDLVSELKQRAAELRQVQEKSFASSKVSAPPRTLVLVDDLQSVIRSVSNFSDLVDECAQVGQVTGIYFVFAETANALAALRTQNYNFQTLKSACSYGCGISFSLEESALRLLTVQLTAATIRAHSSTMGKGRALLAYQNRPTIVQAAAVTSGVTGTTEQQKRLESFIDQLVTEQESDEGGPEP